MSGQIGPFHARISYHLEPTARGTRLTNDVSLEPSPGVMRLAARLAIPRVKAALAQNLGKLTEILETYSQDAGPSLALSWRDRAASGMI